MCGVGLKRAANLGTNVQLKPQGWRGVAVLLLDAGCRWLNNGIAVECLGLELADNI